MNEEPQAIQQSYAPNEHHKSSHWPHVNIDEITGYVTTFFYNIAHLEEFARQANLKLVYGDSGRLAYQTVALPNGKDVFMGRQDVPADFWTLQHIAADADGAYEMAQHIQEILTNSQSQAAA
jgi:hypothetical protein